MNRIIIDTLWDRKTRDDININFKYLFNGVNSLEKTISDLIVEAGKSDPEVIQARGGEELLNDRLNKTDSLLSEKVTKEEMSDELKELEEELKSRKIDVRDFGAKGNGVASDTEAFQATLNLAKSSRGVEIYIPAGVYLMTDELIIYENTTIIASPQAHMSRNHNMYMLLNGDRGVDFQGFNGNGNININGGTWDMNGEDHDGATCFCFGHAENLTFKNVTIRNVSWSHGIEINACKNVIIEECNFEGYHNPGNRGFSEAIQLDLMKSTGVFNAFGSYDNTPCVDVTINKCRFDKSDRYSGWGRGIGSHSSTINKWHENIIISNNFFYNTEQWAIRPYSWNNLKIVNNFFIGCGGGIGAGVPVGSTDQADENGVDQGHSQDSFNFEIKGNLFKGVGSYGVAINLKGEDDGRFKDCVISGNTFTNIKNTGIHLNFVENINISGNVFNGIDNHGIWGAGIIRVIISDNNVHGAGQTAGEWQGFRITTSPSNIVVFTGNVITKKQGSSNNVEVGAYFSAGVENLTRYGNHMLGLGIRDNSITPKTDGRDIT